MYRLPRYFAALATTFATGILSAQYVSSEALSWYDTLVKPPFTPPSWVFMPVWLILYAFTGIALGAVWSKIDLWHPWFFLFLVTLAFNVSWTLFFFGLRAIFIALIDAVCLALMVLGLVLGASEIRRTAALLLLPYLGWVLFACYLNVGIWLLNPATGIL